MLDKLKQAKRMWEAGYIHSEIQEVTGLSSEVEFAVTTLKASPELVYAKLPKIKPGMKSAELREVLLKG